MKVAVALSGGADSLSAILILQAQGVEVFGVHALFKSQIAQDIKTTEKLQEICSVHNLQLHILDLQIEFAQKVVTPFIDSYLNGKTPNPCAICNRNMKFGILYDEAMKLGATHFATGHYAKMEEVDGRKMLCKGFDTSKDQSYFLTRLEPHKFANILFPLANLKKNDLVAELKRRNIEIPAGVESQEICFIPTDYRDFLRGVLNSSKIVGNICLSTGEKIGQHFGLWQYTLGQRRGLGIAWSEPLYVIDKVIKNNTLVVGTKEESMVNGFIAKDLIYFEDYAKWGAWLYAQAFYKQKPMRVEINRIKDKLHVIFEKKICRTAPDQILAIYNLNGQVLGSGIIETYIV